ncbi:MAG: ROK family protein [Fusobacteriaceae bacterium]
MQNLVVFDLGGSSVKYGIVNFLGDLILKDSFPTPKDSFSTLLNLMVTTIKSLSSFSPVGVAISAPGAVDSSKGIIKGISSINYIHNFEIKKKFEKAFNLPVSIENDGNCLILAELWKGNGKEFQNIVSLVLGSGIGGAVIQNGTLIKGKNFQSGEFGYILLKENKTWSSLCSTTSLVESARKITNNPNLNGKTLLDLDLKENLEVRKLLEIYYINLVKGIYNLQCSFDTDTFIIGGGISSNNIFLENILKVLDEFYDSLEIKVEKPFIQKAFFENDANLIGAAYNFINSKKSM